MQDKPLWTPSPERLARANVTRFMGLLNERHGLALGDYAGLYRWSIDHLEDFWRAVWDFGGVIAETRGERVLVDAGQMPGAPLLSRREAQFRREPAAAPARRGRAGVLGRGPGARRLSAGDLYDEVSRVQQALAAAGVSEGDRVAAFMPNMPEAVIAMLAAASLGATFTSCSPDFGVQGVLDRFGQVEPKVLFCCDGYYYNGKVVETLARIAEIMRELPSVRRVVVVPYVTRAARRWPACRAR